MCAGRSDGVESIGDGYAVAMAKAQASMADNIGRGILSGIAGTVVMTAFQKFIEMPLTGRAESYAPADFAQKVLPVEPDSEQARDRLNWATHFALGACGGPPTASPLARD